jgi:hypothetical protein
MLRIGIIINFVLAWFSVFAQKPLVHISTDSKLVEIGEAITISVKSNMAGNVEIDFPDEFVLGSGVMNGMEQEMDYNTGTVNTFYYFSQNGAFNQEGTFTLKAFVKNKNKVYKSNSLTIKVVKNAPSSEDISSKQLKQPVFGTIEKSKIKIYEGEPLVIHAKVYSKLDITMLEGYKSFEVDGKAEVFSLDPNPRLLLTNEKLKGQDYLTFTFGKQLVFPTNTGKNTIKPYEMSLRFRSDRIFSESISFRSLATSIEVIPLPDPAPEDFIGAVGKYSLHNECSLNTVKAGDVVPYKVILTGVGNLHNVETPKLKLPKGIIVYGDPERKEEIEYGAQGADGKITFTYNLQVNTNGTFDLKAPSVSYFSPELKKYVQIRGKSLTLEGKGSVQVNIEGPQEPQQSEQETAISVNKNDSNTSFWTKNKLIIVSVLAPVLLAFLFLFFMKRPKKAEQELCATHSFSSKELKTEASTCFASLCANFTSLSVSERFTRIQQALHLLLCSKLNVPSDEFSTRELIQQASEKSLPLENLNALTRTCEEGKYSFDAGEEYSLKALELLKVVKEELE